LLLYKNICGKWCKYYFILFVNLPQHFKLYTSFIQIYQFYFRSSLERLLNEKYFRDQLALFSVDTQQTEAFSREQHGRTVGKNSSNAIPLLDEHRKNLIPILLRYF
jgi:hypothetical protein